MELSSYPVALIPQHPLSISWAMCYCSLKTVCRHNISAAAEEGKEEQRLPITLSLIIRKSAVGKNPAALGYQRKETVKGPVAGLDKRWEIRSVGKVPKTEGGCWSELWFKKRCHSRKSWKVTSVFVPGQIIRLNMETLQAMNSISSSYIHLHLIHSPSSHYTMWLK